MNDDHDRDDAVDDDESGLLITVEPLASAKDRRCDGLESDFFVSEH